MFTLFFCDQTFDGKLYLIVLINNKHSLLFVDIKYHTYLFYIILIFNCFLPWGALIQLLKYKKKNQFYIFFLAVDLNFLCFAD